MKMSDNRDSRQWRKARASTDGSGCVEVSTDVPGEIAIRDSKLGGDSPVLVFTEHEWLCFKDGIAKGEF